MSWPVPPHGFLGSQAATSDNDTYQISRSLRFNVADSTYLSRTPSVAGNRKTWTFSAWAKRTTIGAAQANYILGNAQAPSGTNGVYFGFGSDTLFFGDYGASGWDWYVQSSSLYRDASAWYHVVAQYDTTQATASERVKLYVNGVRLTAFDGASTYPTLNVDGRFNQASVEMAIGRLGTYNGNYFNGYITEVNFIDGQALTPSSFGETDAITGRWKAKAYTGAYGTNGFYLPFSDNSGVTATTIGKDNSTYRMLTAQLNGTSNGIEKGGDLTGIANGKSGTVSMWCNFTGASSGAQVLWNTRQNATIGTTLYTYRGADGKIGIWALNSAGAYIMVAATTANIAASAGLYHIYMSWDLAVSNQIKIYVNGVDQALTISTFTNDTIQYSVPNHGFGGNLYSPFTPTTPAMVGQLYVNYSTYLDPVTNISKFYNAGKPVSLGTSGQIPTGISPIVYLDGDATSILTNRGTGGNFAAFGTLATGTTYEGVGSHYNNWTPNNLSVTPGAGNDSLTDSPSNYGTISTTLVNDTYQISKSLRFNSADSAYLSRTPSVAGNRTVWTYSVWVKRSLLNTYQAILNVFLNTSNCSVIDFTNTNNIRIFNLLGGAVATDKTTSAVYQDTSSWMHIVVNSNGASALNLYVNGVQVTAFGTNTGPTADNWMFNSTVEHRIGREEFSTNDYTGCYLAEINWIDGQALTPSSFGTRDINTYLWKPKAYTGTYGTNGFYLNFSDSSNTTAATLGKDQAGSNDWTPNNFSVSAGPGNDSLVDSPTYYGTDTGVGGEARGDYCTWDSLNNTGLSLANGNLDIIAGGTNDALAKGTVSVASGKWYWEATCLNISGIVRGSVGISTATQNLVYFSENGSKYLNGSGSAYGSIYSTGDVIGVALDADNGTLTFYRNNISQGTAFTGLTSGPYFPLVSTAGGGSFAHNFGQRPFIHAAPSGFRALRDYNKLPTPTGGEVRGNYATLNPLDNGGLTLANGNLDASRATATWASVRSTVGMSSGKWYWEITPTSGLSVGSTTNQAMIGISKSSAPLDPAVGTFYGSANGWGYYFNSGQKWNNNSGANYGATYTNNDVIGIAFDADNGTLTFYKNGISQGTAFSGLTSGPYFPTHGHFGTASSVANFGQRPWAYDAPFGFMPLCTTLLPQPIVQKPSSYFDAVTYTGNGASRSITSLGFSPDLVWLKERDDTEDHFLFDKIRGANNYIRSNLTNAEGTISNYLTAFNSNGFSLGDGGGINGTGDQYVSWSWKESPIAGMDIVSYSGTGAARTVPHNLGVPPKMIIIKGRTNAYNWNVYHAGLLSPTNNKLYLDDTAQENNGGTNAGTWNSTAPTSSVFSLGTFLNVNENLKDFIAYCFAEIEGFSKFGSYTGNGLADGPFVYCGFRPRYIMYKRTDAAGNWNIVDTARDTYNPEQTLLRANLGLGDESNAVYTQDFLANGWKIRSTNVDINVSTATYIFAAFAEAPFKYARAR